MVYGATVSCTGAVTPTEHVPGSTATCVRPPLEPLACWFVACPHTPSEATRSNPRIAIIFFTIFSPADRRCYGSAAICRRTLPNQAYPASYLRVSYKLRLCITRSRGVGCSHCAVRRQNIIRWHVGTVRYRDIQLIGSWGLIEVEIDHERSQ